MDVVQLIARPTANPDGLSQLVVKRWLNHRGLPE